MRHDVFAVLRGVKRLRKARKTYGFVAIVRVVAVSWPSSRFKHVQKPFRDVENPPCRRSWCPSRVHTGRGTGSFLEPPVPLRRSLLRCLPSLYYSPLVLHWMCYSSEISVTPVYSDFLKHDGSGMRRDLQRAVWFEMARVMFF